MQQMRIVVNYKPNSAWGHRTTVTIHCAQGTTFEVAEALASDIWKRGGQVDKRTHTLENVSIEIVEEK